MSKDMKIGAAVAGIVLLAFLSYVFWWKPKNAPAANKGSSGNSLPGAGGNNSTADQNFGQVVSVTTGNGLTVVHGSYDNYMGNTASAYAGPDQTQASLTPLPAHTMEGYGLTLRGSN